MMSATNVIQENENDMQDNGDYVNELSDEENQEIQNSLLSSQIQFLGAKAIRLLAEQLPADAGVDKLKKVYVTSILVFVCLLIISTYQMKKQQLCYSLFVLCMLLIFMPAAFGDMGALSYVTNKIHLIFFNPLVHVPMSVVNQKIDVLTETIYDTLVSDLNDDRNINPYTLFEVMVD